MWIARHERPAANVNWFYGIGSVLFVVCSDTENALCRNAVWWPLYETGFWRDFVCQWEDGCCNRCRAQHISQQNKEDIGRMWPRKRQSSNYIYLHSCLVYRILRNFVFRVESACEVRSARWFGFQCFSLKCHSRGPRWDMRTRVDLPIAIMLKTESKRSYNFLFVYFSFNWRVSSSFGLCFSFGSIAISSIVS